MAEATRLIVEFVGAVLIAFISHYLTKSHYERKRQDDLADRDYKRRTERLDKKIVEANAYIENLAEASQLIWTQGNNLVHTRNFNGYMTRYEKIRETMDSLAIKAPNVFLLGDSRMQDLNREMVRLISNERQEIHRLFSGMGKQESINKDEFKNNLSEFNKKTASLYRKMKIRLDELDQTTKQ